MKEIIREECKDKGKNVGKGNEGKGKNGNTK